MSKPIASRVTLYFLFLCLVKILIVCCIGYHYEFDSPRYLWSVRSFMSPPLYPIFLKITTTIVPSLYFVIICQTIAFCIIIFSAAFLLQQHKNLAFYLFWAIEPISAFYCSNLMTEWLFLSLVFFTLALISNTLKRLNGWHICSWAMGICACYLTRWIGISLLILAILLLLIDRSKSLKYRILHCFLLFLFFNLALLPLRLDYKRVLGTYQLNAYSGINLWNSVSVLYPDAPMRKQPQTSFQVYLQSFQDSVFATQNALLTHHMWNDSFPALKYANLYQLDPLKLQDTLQKNSYQLIFQTNPLNFITRFVIPNFMKPFVIGNENYVPEVTRPYIFKYFGEHQTKPIYYYSFVTWIAAIGLAIGLFIRPNSLILQWVLLYWLMIGISSAFFLRYIYVVSPLIFYEIMKLITTKIQNLPLDREQK